MRACSIVSGATLFVSLLIGSAVAAESPGKDSKALGIVQYEVDRHDGAIEVTLMMEPGVLGGMVVIEPRVNTDPGPKATLERDEAQVVSLAWDEGRGVIKAWNEEAGLVGHSYFDLQAFEWVPEPAFTELLEAHGKDLELLAAVMTDIQNVGRRAVARPTVTSDLSLSSDLSCELRGASNTLSTKHHGQILCGLPSCRGFATAGSKSICCQEANQDMHLCCWNYYCIGCCRWLECDAGCGVGDYLCFCGQSGESCYLH